MVGKYYITWHSHVKKDEEVLFQKDNGKDKKIDCRSSGVDKGEANCHHFKGELVFGGSNWKGLRKDKANKRLMIVKNEKEGEETCFLLGTLGLYMNDSIHWDKVGWTSTSLLMIFTN